MCLWPASNACSIGGLCQRNAAYRGHTDRWRLWVHTQLKAPHQHCQHRNSFGQCKLVSCKSLQEHVMYQRCQQASSNKDQSAHASVQHTACQIGTVENRQLAVLSCESPIHFRRPPPNGRYAKFSVSSLGTGPPGRHLSTSNSSGLCQLSGALCSMPANALNHVARR